MAGTLLLAGLGEKNYYKLNFKQKYRSMKMSAFINLDK